MMMTQRIRFWIFSVFFFALNTLDAVAANAPAGTIKLIKGEVQILDSKAAVVGDTAGKTKRPLTVGAPFYVGETVVTKGDGRVKLEFVEGKNEVVLGTGTSLLIERASTDPLKASGTTLSLARGEVRSSVNHKYSGKGGDAYEVKTPNAVAGVRGTIFLARFNPANMKSEVATERGLVAVKSLSAGGGGREVMVKPGMFTAAVGSAPAAPPAPLSSNKDLEGAVKSLGSGESSSEGGESAKNEVAPKNDKQDKQDKQEVAGDKQDSKDSVAKKDDAPASSDKGGGDKKDAAPAGDKGGDSSVAKKEDGAPAAGSDKSAPAKKDDAPANASNDKKPNGPAPASDNSGDGKQQQASNNNGAPPPPAAKSDGGNNNGTASTSGASGNAPAPVASNGGSNNNGNNNSAGAPPPPAPASGTAKANTSSGGGSAVPLGREPVMASASGGVSRGPASIPSTGPVGLPTVIAPPGPPPVANIASQTINRTVTNVNTINQTVNQQTQQAQHVMSKIRIKIQ